MPVLNYIRGARRPIPMGKKVFNTMAVLILGIALGVFSKFLDTVPSNELPFILARLDIGNFLGRFAIWSFQLLFIFQFYSRFFPKKLCDDMVRPDGDFSPAGVCLLVCKGGKQPSFFFPQP